ncbi:orotidine-5'-phosphate decarboxylase [Treponema primitia]|uniref:orotidine-5'-phosphate decarboxylase n=1 Tax=Treponema primitia TaxID=88058 RepID=UPI0002555404|nr:orotidine-5'-phosphate decarboxylase [Treponema primitia]
MTSCITYNMDRLFEAVAARGHVCVGMDTSTEYIPPVELKRASSPAAAVLAYNRAIIDATADIAACYKVQIAYYEELGLAGLETYAKTLAYIRERGALVIADIKRGDIADTASRYAKAHFDGDFEADFVTLSPYMGMDSIEPWLSWADTKGKGAFVLMRTSNKGMRDFEYQELKTGGRLYDTVGDRLSELAAAHLGKHGYGVFGAVVGADPKSGAEREEAKAIREKRSNLFFLIPGYGAQGGGADDAALLLREGNGGVVNASRSILKAWSSNPEAAAANADNTIAAGAARKAAMAMRDAIWAALGSGK